MGEAISRKTSLFRAGVIMPLLLIVIVWLMLVFPGHPKDFTLHTLLRFPLELPAILLALVFAPIAFRSWVSGLLVAMLAMLLLMRLADIGSYLAFNRKFNPLLELHLVSDGWNLVSTSVGPAQAIIIATAALGLLLLFVRLLYKCMLQIAGCSTGHRKKLIRIALPALLFGSAGLLANNHFELGSNISAGTLPEMHQRLTHLHSSIVDQQKFVEQLQRDEVLDVVEPQFTALKGKDVIVLFIESYGRGYLDAERFTNHSHNLLEHVEDELYEAGLSAKSGWIESPIRGGRSWLAHASFQSGLKINNQARYDRLITTDRDSLSALFNRAGWRSSGVMPAIQFDWPESEWYGYELLYESEDLGYDGERFGYVTMPDQYTLSHFENSIRHSDESPVMATIALLSTHAPWTPLPNILDWDEIGDGSIFDGSQRFGERISWRYRSKVQDMYMQSFDYTFNVIGEYLSRYADDGVIIVLGDHQPAPIINGWGKSGDVPIHFITRDKSLLERLPRNHWTPGMIPSADKASLRMWEARTFLATEFE
ncbi:MAG: hypothetical protein AB8B63_07650 [Granulosicoccus sp.]